jgi:hypothetical protein
MSITILSAAIREMRSLQKDGADADARWLQDDPDVQL